MCCMYLGGSGGDGGKGQRGKTNLDKVPDRPANGNAKEVYDRGVPDHLEQVWEHFDCCYFQGASYDSNGCSTFVL